MAATVLVAGPAAAAGPGELDAGFGTDGKVFTGVSKHGDDQARAVVVHDGKIVAAGGSGTDLGSGTEFAIARYNADGTLDDSFGGDGIVTTGFGGGLIAHVNALAVQPDGAIVAVGDAIPPFNLGGQSPGDVAMARYLPNGDLDPSFSGDGKLTTDLGLGGNEGASDVAVQGDGKIVVAGSSSPGDMPSDFMAARFTSGGDPDATFGGGDGVVTTDFGPDSFDNALGVAIQGDGRIVAAGSSSSETAGGLSLVRYEADGDLDAGFGSGGKVVSDLGAAATDVAIQPGGEIVAAGVHTTYDENDVAHDDIAVARFDANGDPDASFGGGDGGVTTDMGANDWANGIALAPGGEIVVAGVTGPSTAEEAGFGEGTGGDFALARYDSSGALDAGFDGDGKVTTGFGAQSADVANGVALTAGGGVVAAGLAKIDVNTFDPLAADFVLAGYTSAGALDPAFGSGGRVDTVIGDAWGDRAEAAAVQGDGRIVVAGSTIEEQGRDDEDTAVARYWPDGSLDTSFGGDGLVTLDLTGHGGRDSANAVVVQPDGAIVVAGESDGDFALARLDPSGALDPAFGIGGKMTTDFGGDADEARDAALQADGKIVVSGAAGDEGLAVARYDSSGALDTGFGGDGKVTDPSFTGFESGGGVAVQPSDGAIVAVGGFEGPGGSLQQFALARFAPDGTPDGAFGGDGVVTTDLTGGHDVARDVAVRADGTIVAVGSANGPDTPVATCGGEPQMDFGAARYGPNGDLDTGFSGDGTVTTDFGGTFDQAFAGGVQDDGRVLAAGRATGDFALARYETGGALDAGFGAGGEVVTDMGGACDFARDAAGGPGEVLLTGSRQDGAGSRFALAQYLLADDDQVSTNASAGQTVATGGSPSPSNPIVTAVTTPNAGQVEITESSTTTTNTPNNYTLADAEVDITAPAASRTDPLRIVFELHSSLLPPGGVGALDVFRDGKALSDCTGDQLPPGKVACVLQRDTVAGNGRITILAEQASAWNFGSKRTPAPRGGPPPGRGP